MILHALLLLWLPAAWLFTIAAAGMAAWRKGYGPYEWLALAFMFGPIALIALAAMPLSDEQP